MIFIRLKVENEQLIAEYSQYPRFQWDEDESELNSYSREVLADRVRSVSFLYASEEEDELVWNDSWEEDLNLAFLDELPSQISAKNYTELVMNELSDTFYLGGHSKGGNLAVYAAMHVPDYIQDGIVTIFNHDGPGFLPQVYTSHEFLTIRKRIRKTVPQSAFVGLILEQHSDYTVVKSDAFSVLQHDPYSWVIENGAFVKIASINTISRYTNQALSHWIYSLDPETRHQFVDTLYDLLGGNGMGRMDALTEVPSQTILRMIRKLMLLPSDDRKLVLDTIRALVSAAFGEMRQFFSDRQMQLWAMLNTLADRLPLR